MNKLKRLYWKIILRLLYSMKPNEYGTYDMKVNPSVKNAKLDKLND